MRCLYAHTTTTSVMRRAAPSSRRPLTVAQSVRAALRPVRAVQAGAESSNSSVDVSLDIIEASSSSSGSRATHASAQPTRTTSLSLGRRAALGVLLAGALSRPLGASAGALRECARVEERDLCMRTRGLHACNVRMVRPLECPTRVPHALTRMNSPASMHTQRWRCCARTWSQIRASTTQR
jgi:hypothetical protein